MKKHEKYLKSKNDVKKLRVTFNQELWAIWFFLKSRKFGILWAISPVETTRDFFVKKGVSASQKLSAFSKKMS